MQILLYLCSRFSQPYGWVGQDIMDSVLYTCSFLRLFAARLHCRSRKRTFSERYLLRSNFATLVYQKISQRSVHAECIIPICECVSERIQRICHYIIRDWRGLAELLILVKGNAKARSWDKQESFSHVFFVSITVV